MSATRRLFRVPRGYWAALLGVGAACAAGALAAGVLGPAGVLLLLAVPVVVASNLWGVGPGLCASVGSVVAAELMGVSEGPTLFVFALLAVAASTWCGRRLGAYEREKGMTAPLERVRRSGGSTAPPLTADLLLREFLAHVHTTLRADAAVVLLATEDGRSLEVRAATGAESPAVGTVFPLDRGLCLRVVRSGSPVVMADLATGRDVDPAPFASAIRSLIGVRLWVTERVIGVLYLGAPRPGAFTRHEGLLLQSLANHMAVTIEYARIAEFERRSGQVTGAASHSKDRFLAMVAHELRAPMTVISAWAWGLRSGKLSPAETAQALEAIDRNARLQARLIEDLLDVSRAVAGKLKLEMTETELHAAVEGALETVRPAAEAKGIHLDTDIDRLCGPIAGDPTRLQQIAHNLLWNAVKFTRNNGRIAISTRRAGTQARLRVQDTGVGIAPGLVPFVFDAFRQAEEGGPRYEGLGLGLAIVKQLVELHGGRVQAESAGPDQGTTFTVDLPIPALRTDRRARPRAGSTLRLDGLRVLLVDDDAPTLAAVGSALGAFGASVASVRSPDDALREAVTRPPDVMIMDLNMPEQDGLELLRALRSAGRVLGDTPAVAFSAYDRRTHEDAMLASGFQAYLEKPAHPEQIARCLDRLVSRALPELRSR